MKKRATALQRGDVRIGKASAQVSGAYRSAGVENIVNLKLNAPAMAIDELEARVRSRLPLDARVGVRVRALEVLNGHEIEVVYRIDRKGQRILSYFCDGARMSRATHSSRSTAWRRSAPCRRRSRSRPRTTRAADMPRCGRSRAAS